MSNFYESLAEEIDQTHHVQNKPNLNPPQPGTWQQLIIDARNYKKEILLVLILDLLFSYLVYLVISG